MLSTLASYIITRHGLGKWVKTGCFRISHFKEVFRVCHMSIFNLIQGNCLLQKSAHLNLTRECRMIATGVQTFAQIVRNEIFQFLVKLKSALHHLQGKRQ